jgi:hypothetical protein
MDSFQFREALINSTKLVIASEARQSHSAKSVAWRLLRHCVPRNDELIRASLALAVGLIVDVDVLRFEGLPY